MPGYVLVPFELVVRESCGAASKHIRDINDGSAQAS